MKSRGSVLLRVAAGFVTGSAVGWVAHDSLPGRTPNNRAKERDFLRVLSADFKPPIPWDKNWDKRDPVTLTKSKKDHPSTNKDASNDIVQRKPTASRHVLLIRHGQYNEDGETDEQRALTPLGIEQAEFTGQRLAKLDFPYTKIIHSTMTRARQTAAIIHKSLPNLPMTESDLLQEGAPYPPEPPLRRWRPDYKIFQDGARIEAAFCKYIHRADPDQSEDSCEVIVCHANVIRYLVCRALQLPPEAWLRLSLQHGSLTLLTIRPSGHVVLRSFGDAGFMPPKSNSVV